MAKRTWTDLEGERGDVDRIAAQLGLAITVVATVVGTFFAIISITDIEFHNIPFFFGETTLTKFGLGLFFVHWGWGVKTDLDLQARHYCRDPNGSKLFRESIYGIVIFVVFFVALFAAHRLLVWFQLMLLCFICANLNAWRKIIAQSNPMAADSRAVYIADKDYFRLEKLELVYAYMNGRWQLYRFYTLIVLAAVQLLVGIVLWDGFGFLSAPRAGIAALVGPGLLLQVPGIMFLGYVLVSSLWMGSMRVRVLVRIAVLQDLAATYRLVPVEGTPWRASLASLRTRLASLLRAQ